MIKTLFKKTIRKLNLIFLLIIFSSNAGYSQDNNLPSLLSILGQTDQNMEVGNILNQNSSNDLKVENNNLQIIRPLLLEELSKLEKSYNSRINFLEDKDVTLRMQGHDLFSQISHGKSPRVGAIQDDYILGIGDEVVVVTVGGSNLVDRSTINRNGNLVFSSLKIRPISALGRTLAEVKKEINSEIELVMLETKSYIALGKVRQLNIILAGEVHFQGIKALSGLSNVIDALFLGYGIKRTGSLRSIKVIKNKKTFNLDLYDLIFGSQSKDINFPILTDDTLIFVPPVSQTAAIVGDVNKSGIYEIKENELTVQDLIDLSGGISNEGKPGISLQRINNKTGELYLTGKVSLDQRLKNGDILIISQSFSRSKGSIRISGGYIKPSVYPLDKFPTISKLIPDESVLDEGAYKLSFLIKSPSLLKNEYIYRSESLSEIFSKTKDINLKSGEEIFIFRNEDLNFILSNPVLDIIKEQTSYSEDYANCEALHVLSERVKLINNNKSIKFYSLLEELKKGKYNNLFRIQNTNISYIGENNIVSKTPKNDISEDGKEIKNRCKIQIPKTYIDNPELLYEILNHLVLVRGGTDKPGLHIINREWNISSFVGNFGQADNYIFSQDKSVLDFIANDIELNGAVRFKTVTKFFKGIKLSNILANKNILTNETYPFLGIIERRDKITGSKSYVTFNPDNILSKTKDLQLEENDSIFIPNIKDINNTIEKYQTTKNNLKTGDKDNLENIKRENSNLNNAVDAESISGNIQNLGLSDNYETLEALELIQSQREDNKAFNKAFFNNNNLTNSNDNLTSSSNNIEQINKEFSNFDKIILNNIVTLNGSVNLPGYYPVGGQVKFEALINYAGGYTENADKNYVRRFFLQQNNNERNVSPGEIFFIPSTFKDKNNIILSGEWEQEREIRFKENLYLSEIIKRKEDFKNDVYLHFATIERKEDTKNSKIYFSFAPSKVLQKKQNFKLRQGDKITLFNKNEIKLLGNNSIKDNSIIYPNLSLKNNDTTLNSSGSVDELINSSIIRLDGEVINPGKMPYAGIFTLNEIIGISGGLKKTANMNSIELIETFKNENGDLNLRNKIINLKDDKALKTEIYSGSTILIPKIEEAASTGIIEITGAIKKPGKYKILPNQSIFDIIKRTGGLLPNAYFDGLVFTREDEKKREIKSISFLKSEIDNAIAIAVQNQSSQGNEISETQIQNLRTLSIKASLYEPVGRIVGNFSDIEVLKSTSAKDGDRIFIPTIPSSVSVVGEVMSPGSILWKTNFKVNDYISTAAGLTQLADNGKIFVIAPNGEAKKRTTFGRSPTVSPGSTIVVPRRIEISSSIQRLSAVSSVVYQLTLSLAGISSILQN